jgi:hypothetical protein
MIDDRDLYLHAMQPHRDLQRQDGQERKLSE